MTPSGWIKLHRRMVEWGWYTDIPSKVLFIHLLLTANHNDRKWRNKTIKRGQILTSRSKLSTETGLSHQQIRTALGKLEATNDLTNKATKLNSIITICNYDSYQSEKEDVNQQSNQPSNRQITSRATNEQPSNTQEGKEDKKIRSIFKAPTSSEVSAYAAAQGYRPFDSEHFVDFYAAKGWMVGKNKMKDWKAAVRNAKDWESHLKANGRNPNLPRTTLLFDE